jgi:hypothetical protein
MASGSVNGLVSWPRALGAAKLVRATSARVMLEKPMSLIAITKSPDSSIIRALIIAVFDRVRYIITEFYPPSVWLLKLHAVSPLDKGAAG